MRPHADSIALKIGRINGLLFFALWCAIGMGVASQPAGALPAIVFLLVPASALVGWRGAALARRLLAAPVSAQRAAGEGFAWGAFSAFAVWGWGFSSAALAAGTVFDGLSPARSEFWLVVATSFLPAMGLAGVVGAEHGIALLLLNRCLVRVNWLLHPTASGGG